MRIGVVGHSGYDGLEELVQHLIAEAPRLGLTLSFEDTLLSAAG